MLLTMLAAVVLSQAPQDPLPARGRTVWIDAARLPQGGLGFHYELGLTGRVSLDAGVLVSGVYSLGFDELAATSSQLSGELSALARIYASPDGHAGLWAGPRVALGAGTTRYTFAGTTGTGTWYSGGGAALVGYTFTTARGFCLDVGGGLGADYLPGYRTTSSGGATGGVSGALTAIISPQLIFGPRMQLAVGWTL